MKYILLISITLVCSISLSAQSGIQIADNRPGADLGPAHIHGTINAAISAAGSGDTIFVVGSGISYGSISISDQLFIFGAGHHPDPTLSGRSELGTITFTQFADGSVLSGFKTGSITIQANADNIEISNCWIIHINFLGGQGYLTEGNYIQGLASGDNFAVIANGTVLNSTFRNNIFNRLFRDFQEPSILVDQNLFLAGNYSTGGFYNCSNLMVQNNIFLGTEDSTGCANCVYPVCANPTLNCN